MSYKDLSVILEARAAFASGLAERFHAHLVGLIPGSVAREVLRLASIPATLVK
jgi:hypothetical protein